MTKPFGNLEKAKVLVIGHDPRLSRSSTIADFSFFANYFFTPIPSRSNEKAKYKLAEKVFSYILDLTGINYTAKELFITNLCNETLSPVPGKTVYIPQQNAINGLNEIKDILSNSKIELIFAMSQQVNYWLQFLGFYSSSNDFLKKAEPKSIGSTSTPPYYLPKKKDAFRLICGKHFLAENKYNLIPILHVKNWPLKENFEKVYGNYYKELINSFN